MAWEMKMGLKEDLLRGAKAIAEHMGMDERTIYHWQNRRRAGKEAPPIFMVGREVFARASELDSYFRGNRQVNTNSQLPDRSIQM